MITKLNFPYKATWVLPFVVSLVLTRGVQAQSTDEAGSPDARAVLDEPVPDKTRPEDRPWAIGVSQEQQMRAKALYQDGNRFLADASFAEAVTKYRAALQHWAHPGIYYSLSLALIRLDRPIEAYEATVAALRHGPDALHPDEYRRARDNQRLLWRQIAEVEIVCDEPGALVTLDGKSLFTGSGRVTTLVMPGQHQIVASKAGYVTSGKVFTLTGATRTRIELRLVSDRRWPAWTHWTATGVGVGSAAVAAALHWRFNVNADRLTDSWRRSCAAGCETYPDTLIPLREQVEQQRNLVYAGYATAGVFVAVGTLLAYLNRPRSAESRVHHDEERLSLVPGGPNGSPGVSIHLPF